MARRKKDKWIPAAKKQWSIVFRTGWPLLIFGVAAFILELLAAPLLARVLNDEDYFMPLLHWATIKNTERFLNSELDVEPDPLLGYRNRPNSVFGKIRIDQHGCRSNILVDPKNPKPLRLAFFGNSLVHGAKDVTNAETVNAYLDSETVETINMGTVAHQVDQMALLVEPTLNKFHPDLVLLGISTDAANRLDRHYLNWTFPTEYEMTFFSFKPRVNEGPDGLEWHSADFSRLLRDLTGGDGAKLAEFLREEDPGVFHLDLFKRWEALPFLKIFTQGQKKVDLGLWPFLCRMNWAPQPQEPNFDLAVAILKHVKKISHQKGADFLILLYPCAHELKGGGDEKYAFWRELLHKNNLPFLDLCCALNACHLSNAHLYRNDRRHLRPAGNEVVARAIQQWMERQDWYKKALPAKTNQID